ncbi:MAG: hypothetical protein ACREBG_13030 [Pyrinomonadaceae bacterium]
MGTETGHYFNLVFAELKGHGFLLESDAYLPNVCGIVARKRFRGSWWSDPLAPEIFGVNELLADHPDVLVTKLISGKVTFVHRKLWRQVYAIGKSREEWQMKNLSASARLLLKKLDKVGSLTTNKLPPSFGAKPGDTARELEKRLLIHAEQFHSASGAHSKLLETWESWGKRVGFRPPPMKPTLAKRRIELRLDKLNEELDGDGRLSWPRGS